MPFAYGAGNRHLSWVLGKWIGGPSTSVVLAGGASPLSWVQSTPAPASASSSAPLEWLGLKHHLPDELVAEGWGCLLFSSPDRSMTKALKLELCHMEASFSFVSASDDSPSGVGTVL